MVGTDSYQLALPPSLSGVHVVFHVPMLRKYTLDPTHVVDWGKLDVDADWTFEEGLVRITDNRDQVMRRNTVREASKGVVAAPRSGGGNLGARGHDVYHLSFLIWDEGTLFRHLIMKMTVAYACDSMYMCV